MATNPPRISFPADGYRLLFEHTGVATLFVEEDTTIALANQWAVRLIGYTRSEIEGVMRWTQFIPDPADRERMLVFHQARRADPAQAPVEYDTTVCAKDGQRRAVTVRATMIPGTTSSLISLVDITDRVAAEKALRRSEAQYRSLVEHMQDTVYRCDLDGNLTFVNPSGARGVGVGSVDELIGRNVAADFYANPADRAALLEELKAHGKITKREVHLRRVDGRVVTIETDSQLFYDEQGRVAGVEGIYSDVTQRRESERQLRENEERLRAITRNIPGVVFQFAVDLDNRYSLPYVSERLGLLLGFTPEPPRVFEQFVACLHEDDRDAFLQSVRAAVETVTPWRFEGRFHNVSGEIIWFQGVSTPARHEGHLVFNGILLDITGRKRAEETSRQSEDKFSKIFMMAPDCIAITRVSDGFILDVNRGFEEITGWPRDEAIGHTSHDIRFWVDRAARDQMCAELRVGHDVMCQDFRFRRKDGSERTGIYSARVMLIDGERCLIFILQDVTERNRLQEESRMLEQQLHQSRKIDAIGQLAGGVAHDFNNMLGVILGETELALLHAASGDPVRNHLEEIQKAAQRSTDLTRQLLAFARRQTIAPQSLDLNDTVAGMLKMLRRLIGEDITLSWAPGEQLWPILMDPSQIDQILANLCVNARDALGGGGLVTIETANTVLSEADCRGHLTCAPGDYVMLSVSDTGGGMDSQTLDNLFEPFFTTKAVGRGTGLGLATVHGIVKQNSGAIDVTSAPGVGSVFRIYLPRCQGQTEAPRPESVRSPVAGGQETILLVEDEPGVLKMGTMMLEKLGYRVLAADTPGTALALADEHAGHIHLLMTDVIMPEMNGRELALRLQARYPDLKRLFCSGYTADVIANRGVLEGGVHFIQKPFSMKGLAAKVREALTTEGSC
jgi:two-component system, cell cycle sensor histidine kinase and response regulator CckA